MCCDCARDSSLILSSAHSWVAGMLNSPTAHGSAGIARCPLCSQKMVQGNTQVLELCSTALNVVEHTKPTQNLPAQQETSPWTMEALKRKFFPCVESTSIAAQEPPNNFEAPKRKFSRKLTKCGFTPSFLRKLEAALEPTLSCDGLPAGRVSGGQQLGGVVTSNLIGNLDYSDYRSLFREAFLQITSTSWEA